MPEIKNTFTQGKMNQDLDERIIPKGQYRDAMNVQVSTSDGENVGTVQNILGNVITGNISLAGNFEGTVYSGNEFECVGSIASETDNNIYYFITDVVNNGGMGYIDAIVEYNKDLNNASFVLVDTNKNTNKAFLKFEEGNNITGINIISEKEKLLFWTDNNNEPRKINIERCKIGSAGLFVNTKLYTNDIPALQTIRVKPAQSTISDPTIVVNNVDGLANLTSSTTGQKHKVKFATQDSYIIDLREKDSDASAINTNPSTGGWHKNVKAGRGGG